MALKDLVMLTPKQIIAVKRMLSGLCESTGLPTVDAAASALKRAIEALGKLPREPQTADEFFEDAWQSTASDRAADRKVGPRRHRRDARQ